MLDDNKNHSIRVILYETTGHWGPLIKRRWADSVRLTENAQHR